jgi:arsenate reductase
MAEAIVNDRLGKNWQAFSAGTRPAGFVHPKAIQVLEDIGIHHQGRSKSVDEIKDIDFDLVVTVCDSAAEECPIWLGPGRRLHQSYPDPATAEGSEEDVLRVFREVCDDIAREIPSLLRQYKP